MSGRRMPPQTLSSGIRSIAPKLRVIKNVLVLGVAVSLAHAAMIPLRSYLTLSPSLKHLSTWHVALTYFIAALSGFYSPSIQKGFRYKTILIFGLLLSGSFTAAVYYPETIVLVSCALLTGAMQGPVWNAAASYLINAATRFVYFSYKPQQQIADRVLIIFHGLVASGPILGNIIATISLTAAGVHANNTTVKSSVTRRTCGRYFCSTQPLIETRRLPNMWNHSYPDPREISKEILPISGLTFLSGGALLSPIVLAVLLDRVTVSLCAKANKIERAKPQPIDVLRVFLDRKMQATIPLLLFIGMADPFVTCTVLKSFVVCLSDRPLIPYVLLCRASVHALFTTSMASVLHHIDRLTVLLAGLLFQIGCLFVMWIWKPMADDRPIVFVIVASWTMADSIWQMLTLTMIFRQYPDSWCAPLAVHILVTHLGIALGFAFCPFGCMEYKIYFAAFLLLAGIVPYALVELNQRGSKVFAGEDSLVGD